MQPLRARPNAPAATIFHQCAQRAITKTAATQRRTPKRVPTPTTAFQQCAQRTITKTAAAQRRTPKRVPSRRPPSPNNAPNAPP